MLYCIFQNSMFRLLFACTFSILHLFAQSALFITQHLTRRATFAYCVSRRPKPSWRGRRPEPNYRTITRIIWRHSTRRPQRLTLKWPCWRCALVRSTRFPWPLWRIIRRVLGLRLPSCLVRVELYVERVLKSIVVFSTESAVASWPAIYRSNATAIYVEWTGFVWRGEICSDRDARSHWPNCGPSHGWCTHHDVWNKRPASRQ